MTDLRQGTHNALAVANIDRGMRDPRDLEDLIDLVERYGVYVVAITGFLDLTTDAGIAMARNEVNQRNIESRNISRRISNGKRKAALKGRNSGGANRPFGWNEDKKTLRESEAQLIQDAIANVAKRMKPLSIVEKWNEQGILSATGKKWAVRALEQILTNPRLYGVRTYKGEILLNANGEPVRGDWDPIITEEQFTAAQAFLKNYGPRNGVRDGRGHTTKYLLSPFVRCGNCGARMRGAAGGRSYMCRSAQEGGCGGCGRKMSEVGRYITELVIQDHERASLQEVSELPPWDKEDELQAVKDQIRELTQRYRARKITGGRYFPLLSDLEEDERALATERRRHEAARESCTNAIANLREQWVDPEFTLEQRQAAIAESLRRCRNPSRRRRP